MQTSTGAKPRVRAVLEQWHTRMAAARIHARATGDSSQHVQDTRKQQL
jgi:hypothetical protein